MLDDCAETSLKVEIERRIDANRVGVWNHGVAADEISQIGFADGDLSKGKEILFANGKCELANCRAEKVPEGIVWHFEGVDAKSVAVESGNHVLICANQGRLNSGVFAAHLLQRFEIAKGASAVDSLSLPTEVLVRLKLCGPHNGVGIKWPGRGCYIGECGIAVFVVPANIVSLASKICRRSVVVRSDDIAEYVPSVVQDHVEDRVHPAGVYFVHECAEFVIGQLWICACPCRVRGEARLGMKKVLDAVTMKGAGFVLAILEDG